MIDFNDIKFINKVDAWTWHKKKPDGVVSTTWSRTIRVDTEDIEKVRDYVRERFPAEDCAITSTRKTMSFNFNKHQDALAFDLMMPTGGNDEAW